MTIRTLLKFSVAAALMGLSGLGLLPRITCSRDRVTTSPASTPLTCGADAGSTTTTC